MFSRSTMWMWERRRAEVQLQFSNRESVNLGKQRCERKMDSSAISSCSLRGAQKQQILLERFLKPLRLSNKKQEMSKRVGR